jgi:transposase
VRATTPLNRMFALPEVRVRDVDADQLDDGGPLVVEVKLKTRRLHCPHCKFMTRKRYDTRWAPSSWRHLDMGGRKSVITMVRKRLVFPTHGVVVQGVPFARPESRFTTDFEELVAWLVTRADKTTVATFTRIVWRTVGVIRERVVAEKLDLSGRVPGGGVISGW